MRPGASGKFLVLRGEEVTDRFDEKPMHINGLNVANEVRPQGGTSVADVLQRNVDAIRREHGVPHINHPNFGWAITADELARVQNNKLFEIFNGHPQVNNLGGGGIPGLEETWDAILTEWQVALRRRRGRCPHIQAAWKSECRRAGSGMGDGARREVGTPGPPRGDGAGKFLRVNRRGTGRLPGHGHIDGRDRQDDGFLEIPHSVHRQTGRLLKR